MVGQCAMGKSLREQAFSRLEESRLAQCVGVGRLLFSARSLEPGCLAALVYPSDCWHE